MVNAICYVAVCMGGRFKEEWISLYISLHCSPETIKTLLISYTPIQNKNLKKKIKYSIKCVYYSKQWCTSFHLWTPITLNWLMCDKWLYLLISTKYGERCFHWYPLKTKLKKAFLKDYVMFIDYHKWFFSFPTGD